MFIGVAAFPTAALVLGHAQQADYGKEAGGLGDSDAGLSEPEPAQAWQRGGGPAANRAAPPRCITSPRRCCSLPFLEVFNFSSRIVLF